MLKRGVLLAGILLAGCVPAFGPHYPSATGSISGKVIDAAGRPVARANVTAVFFSSWIQLIPPSSNQLVAGQTLTADDGTFTIATPERIQLLAAQSEDFKLWGELKGVKQSGNIIRISRLPALPSPHA